MATRRDFLKRSALIGAAAMAIPRVHAAESAMLKIGLVGCGGRGCGAVADAMRIDPNITLVAAADIFKERGRAGMEGLRTEFGDRVAVTEETLFDGFEGYKSVIDACDVAFLCTPQHFRPVTLQYAIDANKHVFAEKPVAVDGTGIRMVLDAAAKAKEKGLNLVSGLVNRYSPTIQDIINRIHDGAIGEVSHARAIRMGGPLWTRPRVEGDSEMKYQMRNWVNFDWIAGEFINDVSIHQIDVALWALGDVHPTGAFGMGGRLTRKQNPDAGDMYDSMAVCFDFEGDKAIYSFSRQIPGTWGDAASTIYGSRGKAFLGNVGYRGEIFGENAYVAPKSEIPAGQLEHKVLLDAIRSGGSVYVNNGTYMANATCSCILGKKAAYTGKYVTWDEVLADETRLLPSEYSFDGVPPTLPDEQNRYKIALPQEGYGYLS